MGRKRKHGRRHPGGQLIQPAVNYRAMAALQPHRRGLPDPESEHATTELGRMFLQNKITEPQFLAGQEYARRIGQYRATICGPRTTVGAGRWPGCNPEFCSDECECLRRKQDVQELQEVIMEKGLAVEIVTRHVVAYDLPVVSNLNYLHLGLQALATHLHLTNRTNKRN